MKYIESIHFKNSLFIKCNLYVIDITKTSENFVIFFVKRYSKKLVGVISSQTKFEYQLTSYRKYKVFNYELFRGGKG